MYLWSLDKQYVARRNATNVGSYGAGKLYHCNPFQILNWNLSHAWNLVYLSSFDPITIPIHLKNNQTDVLPRRSTWMNEFLLRN